MNEKENVIKIARCGINQNNVKLSKDVVDHAFKDYLKYSPIPVVFNINHGVSNVYDLTTVQPTDIFGEIKSEDDIAENECCVHVKPTISKDSLKLLRYLKDNGYKLQTRAITHSIIKDGVRNVDSMKIISMSLVSDDTEPIMVSLGRLGGELLNGI